MKRENYTTATLHSIPSLPHDICMVLEQVNETNFDLKWSQISIFLVLTQEDKTD
jgi:hypothetical protein